MTTITMMNVRKNLSLAILVGLTVSNLIRSSGTIQYSNICQNVTVKKREMSYKSY